MFTAASVPMWVAILALIGTILTPLIQGRVNRNSPVNKADAAERFARIATGMADDYDELREELRSLKPLLQELIRLLDQIQCSNQDPPMPEIRDIITEIRKRMY